MSTSIRIGIICSDSAKRSNRNNGISQTVFASVIANQAHAMCVCVNVCLRFGLFKATFTVGCVAVMIEMKISGQRNFGIDITISTFCFINVFNRKSALFSLFFSENEMAHIYLFVYKRGSMKMMRHPMDAGKIIVHRMILHSSKAVNWCKWSKWRAHIKWKWLCIFIILYIIIGAHLIAHFVLLYGCINPKIIKITDIEKQRIKYRISDCFVVLLLLLRFVSSFAGVVDWKTYLLIKF